MEPDIYQKRYLDHQKRKANMLFEIMNERHSERVFDPNLGITYDEQQKLIDASRLAPSSCSRRAVSVIPEENRYNKNLLAGLLIGGTGWLHRAPIILMLWAEMEAYKSPNERIYMPYLDAGHISQSIQLTATSIGLGSCFCNPNCMYVDTLNSYFAPKDMTDPLFVGAIAVGKKK